MFLVGIADRLVCLVGWFFWALTFLFLFGEFDPGSGRTLAACLTHASRTLMTWLLLGWMSGERERHNIQYFGARVNVLKALLTGLNGGYDDVHKDYKVFDIEPVRDEVLDFDTVKANFEKSLDWLTDTYVDALNIILHD